MENTEKKQMTPEELAVFMENCNKILENCNELNAELDEMKEDIEFLRNEWKTNKRYFRDEPGQTTTEDVIKRVYEFAWSKRGIFEYEKKCLSAAEIGIIDEIILALKTLGEEKMISYAKEIKFLNELKD